MRCKFLLFCVILETFLFVVKSKIRFDNGDYDNILCHVDTRIGTDLWKKESTLSNTERPHGFVYPGVGLPFAMTQWTPQTVNNDIAYLGQHERLQGFRATHYPNGAAMSEYGAFTVMPTGGELKVGVDEHTSQFSYDNEIAKPYYYGVKLDDYGIYAELTSAAKSGYLRFTYPASENSHIVIDNPRSNKESYIRIIPERNEIEGLTTVAGRVGNQGYVGREFACYFVARVNKPFKAYGLIPSPKDCSLEQLCPSGFKGKFYNNNSLNGRPVLVRTDEKVDFRWISSPAEGIDSDNFSIRYTSTFVTRTSGTHTFF